MGTKTKSHHYITVFYEIIFRRKDNGNF
ncbi:hypothetical protein [Nostoc sp. UHCC 0251]